MKAATRAQKLPKLPFIAAAVIVALCVSIAIVGTEVHPDDPNVSLENLAESNTLSSSAILAGNMLRAVGFLAIASGLAYIVYRAFEHVALQWSAIALILLLVSEATTLVIGTVYLISQQHQPIFATSSITTAIIALGLALALPAIVPQRISLYRAAAERTKTAKRRQDELITQLVTSEQDQRNQLSNEIHDTVTQTVSATFRDIETVQEDFDEHLPPHVLDKVVSRETQDKLSTGIDRAVNRSQKAVEECRHSINTLRPTVLDDFGLPAAISNEVEHQQKQGWDIELDVSMPDRAYQQRPKGEHETALWRVFIEALQNISKHAKASTIRVSLDLTGIKGERPHAALTIIDDGVGFDPQAQRDPHYHHGGQHIGLISMQERIRRLGGNLKIISCPGQGTTIKAEIPIESEED